MYNFRTDLAVERNEIYKKANKIENNIQGIDTEEEKDENVTITRVKVTDESGAEAIGKPVGSYITLDVKGLKFASEEEINKASEKLGQELKDLINRHCTEKDDILVVGLGNLDVTPDALGPKVISYVDITRHIIKYVPQYIDKDTRPVSAVAPGVLGTTGIETFEILKGIVENIEVKLIIAIDALASRSMSRISNTIQLSDTGIHPGAGVENKRKEITKNTLNVPVIAIGVPTVVDVATIASDSIDIFVNKMNQEIKKDEFGEKYSEFFTNLLNEDKYEMIKETLIPENYNFIVTPKEIDEIIDNMANIVASGINLSLQ